MSADVSNVSRALGKSRAVVALAGCCLAVALVLIGYNAGMKYPARHDSSEKSISSEGLGEKSQAKWNPALGNLVIIAPELGFNVTGPKDAGSQAAAISKKIENQLLSLRQLYRQEVEKNPALMGSILLELSINSSGEVTQAKELASRMTHADFKKAVLAEVLKWKFSEIGPDSVRINCPLLFVREGMDMTTLIQWEKALGLSGEGASLARKETPPIQEEKSPEKTGPTFAVADSDARRASANQEQKLPRQNSQKSGAKSIAGIYELKASTTVRKEPSFASSSLAKVDAGTKVAVIAVRGDWLEIHSKETGRNGFIRREFARPVLAVRKK